MIRAVPCMLDGQERMLRLDLGGMAWLEDHGCPLEELVEQWAAHLRQGQLSAKRLRLLLCAMLQGEQPPPSLDSVGRWVDGENFFAVSRAVGDVIRLAFPPPPDTPSPPEGAGTGEKPSASPSVPSP